MAGFFGLFNYEKEGRGVYADDPPQSAFVAFFSILGRKFWKICTINLMYVILSLPALVVAFFVASPFLNALLPGLNLDLFTQIAQAAGIELREGLTLMDYVAYQMTQSYFLTAVLLVGLGLVVVGPVHAGVVFLLRNYAREEHAFVWMDFKDHAGKNWKQSLALSAISLVLLILFIFVYLFYDQSGLIQNDLLRTALKTVVLVAMGLWCMMQFTLYPMMVTFDLTLRQLIRNALLLTLIRLPLSLLVLLASVLILLLIPAVLLFMGYGISFLIGVIWVTCFGLAFNLYLVTFFAWRGIDRYMMQRPDAREEEAPAAEASSPPETGSLEESTEHR